MLGSDETRAPTAHLQMRISAVLLVATIALTAGSCFLPWWGMGYQGSRWSTHVWTTFSPTKWHIDSLDLDLVYSDAGRWGHVSELMGLMTTALVLAIVFEIVVLGVVLLGNRQARWIFGSWIGVFLFVILVGFSANIGPAVNGSPGASVFDRQMIDPVSHVNVHFDFVGKANTFPWFSGGEICWGPLLGWWMMLLAFIICVFAVYISTSHPDSMDERADT